MIKMFYDTCNKAEAEKLFGACLELEAKVTLYSYEKDDGSINRRFHIELPAKDMTVLVAHMERYGYHFKG